MNEGSGGMTSRHDIGAARPGRSLVLAGALAVGVAGPALAQSTTSPPPTSPTVVPVGGPTSAPANPGSALPPAGQGPGGNPSGNPTAGTKPLQNATTPPGITKPGQ